MSSDQEGGQAERTGRRGVMLVVSSPSGAGKSTLCHRLMDEFSDISFSVSYTTRAPRQGERHGVDYHYVDHDTFGRMVAEGRFAEWAEVFDNRYGTEAVAVERALRAGRDVLFDIDWQGAVQLHDKFPDDTVMVFVLPPSLVELERRLRGRGTEADDVVRGRLAKARGELEQFGRYDYLVLNDDLDRAYDQFRAVYMASRLAVRRCKHLADSVLAGDQAVETSDE